MVKITKHFKKSNPPCTSKRCVIAQPTLAKLPEDVISMVSMHLDQRTIIEKLKKQIAEQKAKIKEQNDYIQWTLQYCRECVVCKNMDISKSQKKITTFRDVGSAFNASHS